MSDGLLCSLCGEPVRTHTHFKGLQELWKGTNMPHATLRFFEYKHLPPTLQEISGQFYDIAHSMDDDPRIQEGAEKSMGLRKLLEAKDCFVRAALPPSI